MGETQPSSSKTKRRPRVLTEKRKEQNRIHQKLHRERKKRLQQEQALGRTAQDHDGANPATNADGGDDDDDDDDDDGVTACSGYSASIGLDGNSNTSSSYSPMNSSPHMSTGGDGITCNSHGISLDGFMSTGVPRSPVNVVPQMSMADEAFWSSFEASSSSLSLGTPSAATPDDDTEQVLPNQYSLSSIPTDLSDTLDATASPLFDLSLPAFGNLDTSVEQSWPELQTPESFTAEAFTTPEEEADYGFAGGNAQACQSTQIPFHVIMKAGLDALKNNPYYNDKMVLDATAAWIRKLEKSKSSQRQLTGTTPYVADPYANHIRLEKINLINACIANVQMLGVDLSRVMKDLHKYGGGRHDHLISPFREDQMMLRGPEATQAILAKVSRDLQPCPAQLEQDHDIYVDILPFPEFRQRVMSVRAIEPRVFDENELCKDIEDGGVVCWGSEGSGGAGTPWDLRSWEAKPWFLRKWWMLCGGPEGELWKNSKVSPLQHSIIIASDDRLLYLVAPY
jgi:hypothetical protein